MYKEVEVESRTTPIQEGEDDEDITATNRIEPIGQQRPMTRTRARELNYQVNSFLTVQTNPSPNWTLLNPCDICSCLGTWEKTLLAKRVADIMNKLLQHQEETLNSHIS